MDPLSISASILAVVTAAIQSTKSLSATVKRYKDRDKTLNRLQHELEDLITVLDSLKAAADSDKAVSTLLKSPLTRCSQICREFEDAMKKFSGKTKTGLRDWTKMEFMRGDIHDFMDILASCKSTIMVGLGIITMHHSKLSHEVLERYSEMIKDTAYDLQVRLQRIEASLGVEKQCLELCKIATDQVHHHRKIHTIGEVVANDDTDQFVVTTFADVFDVRKVLAGNRSTQVVGSMTDETVQKVFRDRYNSRFGAVY
ncbi:hypothetical protein VTI28DRAFT_6239 [Corynascus sepedonium]